MPVIGTPCSELTIFKLSLLLCNKLLKLSLSQALKILVSYPSLYNEGVLTNLYKECLRIFTKHDLSLAVLAWHCGPFHLVSLKFLFKDQKASQKFVLIYAQSNINPNKIKTNICVWPACEFSDLLDEDSLYKRSVHIFPFKSFIPSSNFVKINFSLKSVFHFFEVAII